MWKLTLGYGSWWLGTSPSRVNFSSSLYRGHFAFHKANGYLGGILPCANWDGLFWRPSMWGYNGWFYLVLFFFPPLCRKNKKKKKNNKHPPTHQDFLNKMWNFWKASKALFSSPSIWSYMGGFVLCCFFLLLCAVKTKRNNKHPPTKIL